MATAKKKQKTKKPPIRAHRKAPRAAVNTDAVALASGLIHQLRNPLFGITAHLDEFDETQHDSTVNVEACRGLLFALRKECGRIDELLRNLAEFTLRAPIQPGLIELDQLLARIAATARPLCEGRRLTCQIECARDLQLGGDVPRVERALTLMIEHALRRAPEDSTLRIAARRGRGPCLEVVVATPARLSEDFLARFKEPFFDARKGEPGLALAIAARIVAQHGGALTARNARRGGEYLARFPQQSVIR